MKFLKAFYLIGIVLVMSHCTPETLVNDEFTTVETIEGHWFYDDANQYPRDEVWVFDATYLTVTDDRDNVAVYEYTFASAGDNEYSLTYEKIGGGFTHQYLIRFEGSDIFIRYHQGFAYRYDRM